MNVTWISTAIVANYLEELATDDEVIEEVAAEYESVKARLDVRLRRYIALRDFITEQLGQSPYAHGVDRPSDAPKPTGSFRYTGMQIGEAVIQVLQDELKEYPNNPWLNLDEIIEKLADGGLGFPDLVQARAVNAALLKTTGVAPGTASGRKAYSYEQPNANEAEDSDGSDQDGDVDPDEE